MHILEIRLRRPSASASDDVDSAEALELLQSLLFFYRNNGQVCGSEFVILPDAMGVAAHVYAPEEAALAERHASLYVVNQLSKIREAGGHVLIHPLGRAPDTLDMCGCEAPESFVLFTTYLDTDPPLRCGRCFLPVPLYRIPAPESDDHGRIVSWATAYQACDRLFMHSGALERAAYRQLSRLDSSLTKEGLGQCQAISAATRKPVYYYLMHYYAENRRRQEARRCPSCGQEWLKQVPWHRLFDFRCDTCHLLSNISPHLGPH